MWFVFLRNARGKLLLYPSNRTRFVLIEYMYVYFDLIPTDKKSNIYSFRIENTEKILF